MKKESSFRRRFSRDNQNIILVDLPGAYGMEAYTNDELEATDFLQNEHIDVIMNIVDASNLERFLFFTLQLVDTGIPVILALNKSDITKRKIVTPLIGLGILKNYIPLATWFLIGTIIRIPRYVKSMDKVYLKELRKTCGFISLIYLRLQKSYSKEEAFEITRATIIPSAFAVMQSNFYVGTVKRTFSNLVKFQQLTNQIGITKENTMKILQQTEDEYSFVVTKCMFYEVFSSLGVPELTKIMCSVDNAIFNTYLPNKVMFYRGVGNTI